MDFLDVSILHLGMLLLAKVLASAVRLRSEGGGAENDAGCRNHARWHATFCNPAGCKGMASRLAQTLPRLWQPCFG